MFLAANEIMRQANKNAVNMYLKTVDYYQNTNILQICENTSNFEENTIKKLKISTKKQNLEDFDKHDGKPVFFIFRHGRIPVLLSVLHI